MEQENTMKLTIIGCSDAFCSGGRRQTAFLLDQSGYETLIDCGATTALGLKQNERSFHTIDFVVLTHFHGDHYGGLPYLLLEAAKVTKRKKPLTIISPPGLEPKLRQLVECLYPGAEDIFDAFPIHYKAFKDKESVHYEAFKLTALPVQHAPESQPHAIRMEAGGKVLSFSGDTTWHENLIPTASGADLFICECNFFEQETPHHLNYKQFLKHEPELQAKRIMLTHLGEEMLQRQAELQHEFLEQDRIYHV
jgi:ribonuclease BN (tRNA processing enzyme)